MLSTALQGFMVAAWTYAAPMAIRPIWMWAWHGEYPPLTLSYFSTMVDPWLPWLTVAVAIARAGITWGVRRNTTVRDNAVKLAAALSQPSPRALTQYLPAWATAPLGALIVTLLAAGYMATLRLGVEIFILVAAILLVRACVLPRVPGWNVWAAFMAAVPLLFRWLGIGAGTYLIAQAIYLRPASATLANTAAGAFAPELAGIVLGVAVLVVLMPLERGDPKAPVNFFGRFSFSRRLRGSAGAVLFVVALAHALPASAATMMAYCADSWCCFTNNHNAILAVAALVIILASLFLIADIVAIAAYEGVGIFAEIEASAAGRAALATAQIEKAQAIDAAISEALASNLPSDVMEASVARSLQAEGIEITGFQNEIGPNGSITELDIETHDAIIEVTTSAQGKLQQIIARISDPLINPQQKTVILYGPNYGSAAGKSIEYGGGEIYRDLPSLIGRLKNLASTPNLEKM